MTYSIVIPTLNEGENLSSCIAAIRQIRPDAEIVVADGGSSDDTVRIAEAERVLVCQSIAIRGKQCNAGAVTASGSILLFLHADTTLPDNAFDLLDEYFANANTQLGGFLLGFRESHWLLRLYAFFTRIDSVFTSFGDQCIVVRRTFFDSIGGFPEWPLFDDVHFLQKARRHTKFYRFPSRVRTSARRFLKNGIVRQQIRNGILIARYLLGESPEVLAREYEKGN